MIASSKKRVLIALLFVSLSHAAWANEGEWPQLDKASTHSICPQALAIAKAAYQSDNFYLYELPVIPKDLNSTLALQPTGRDISGGNGLIADPAVFKEIPKHGEEGRQIRNIYWQIKPQHGLRFIMNVDPYGWRGDQYTVFAIKEDVQPQQFIDAYQQTVTNTTFTPLINQGWRPPLMMQEKSTGDLWAIDVGMPGEYAPKWTAYSMEADGAKESCTVLFQPKDKLAASLLPASVRRLKTLLGGTLGGGENEGTLQPTARISNQANYTWANIALRPWAALKSEPYNSREEVEEGLKNWSQKARSFQKLYKNIFAQYPKAERDLSAYYKTHFNKSVQDADATAKQVLDIALRAYFMFHKEQKY